MPSGQSKIPAHKNGSFFTMYAPNDTKRSLLVQELGKIQIASKNSELWQRSELTEMQKNVVHQLNLLDASEGNMPRSYAKEDWTAAASGSIPESAMKPRKHVDTRQAYNDYLKEATTPSVEEYHKLQSLGSNMSFYDYAHAKLDAQTKSYSQFAYEMSLGKPQFLSYGDVTEVNRPEGAYYVRGEGYAHANATFPRYTKANANGGSVNGGYKFKHDIDDFNVVESNTLWDQIRQTSSGTLFETNCYALALDMTSSPDGTKLISDRMDPKYALQPGMLSPKTPEYYYYNGAYFISKDGTYSELVQAIKNDVDALGKTMVSYDPEKCDRSSGYVIAVAVGYKGNEKNFHCMRLNSHDLWESKDGENEAVELENDKPAEEILRDMGYTDFVGLFYITEDNK